ncbi:MAG: hypothetical protein HIU82_03350 [Proteobacteria bacterium]|nr:hypothetical protein [Pseudomonadota bacterium]
MTARPPTARLLPTAIALLAAILLPARPAIACDPAAAQMIGIVTMYEGTIGPYPIRLGLQFEPDGTVAGRYAYPASPTTLRLAGRLAGGRTLTLTEFGAHGSPAATFATTIPGAKKTDCDVIRGTWTQAATGHALPVRLRMSDTSMRPLAYYLSPATLRIERAAVAFRAAALAGKPAEVAAALHYPVFVSIGTKRMRLPTPAALRSHYDAIFTPAYLAHIRADIPHLMFVRDQGIMLGGGAVWFNRAGQVITLNSPGP